MRILIDGIPLLAPKTGIGQYTFELSAALKRLTGGPEMSFYYGAYLSKQLKRAVYSGGNLSYNAYKKEAYGWVPAFLKEKIKQEILRIGFRIRRHDLFHATNNLASVYDIPMIVTIHDLSFMRHPETHPLERLRDLSKALPKTLHHARRIIVVSQFTKDELISLFGLAENSIDVIHLGVTKDFRPRDEAMLAASLKEFNLGPKAYILSVGTLEPRKNISALLYAYEMLPDSIKTRWPLAIVGMRGWKNEPVAKEIETLIHKGQLKLLGYVPDDKLPFIYAGASLFVYPSLYEGFGLPPLEAMASGVPALVSSRASLPEVVGSAGVIVEPKDIKALSQTIEALINDPHKCYQMANLGLQRAKHFTWKACAEKTFSVYKDVLKQNGI